MKRNRIVEIDPSSGFCSGVEKAISRAEQLLSSGENIYSLGSMVHNQNEIVRLEKKGLRTISKTDFLKVRQGKVMFRAHGEPPSSYQLAAANHIEIIDATCPIVIALQKRIRKKFEALDHQKAQIVIFGKENHPETIGLLGQTNNTAVLITDPDELSGIDKEKSIYLYAQTTMDPDQFELLEKRLRQYGNYIDGENFTSNCTICKQMKQRKPSLKEFIADKDLVFFVSGKESSNGAMLFNFCNSMNANSYWIQNAQNIDPELLHGKYRIGICGATSTPHWQLEDVKCFLDRFPE